MSTRGTWDVYIKDSGETAWVADGTIYRPNEDWNVQRQGNSVQQKLADGSEAIFTPATKFLTVELNYNVFFDDGTMNTKINTYVQNAEHVKITDDLANDYIGIFTSLESKRLVGEVEQYDLVARFKVLPNLDIS